ncbi:ComF family protein [Frigoribacterium sp. ACAM 257]|uniref:ComF family protein n=1 Tax=Frigoribacterium sp. ACAM 257 TaxID=2508998 RepID=UPI0011B97ACD|nr:phosphoribosyltransferase family protein [Frigoribacterium sp. ACAM 257]TWX40308.1 ComF family protein [Frigoribacterium sp. ACAM 257]
MPVVLPAAVAVALRGALAAVSPVSCAGCGAPDLELCDGCRDLLRARPVEAVHAGLRVVTALRYEFEVREAVLAFKQHGRLRLAAQLGPALRAAVDLALPQGAPPTALVAVPPSPSGRRSRGWDPVTTLARAAGVSASVGVLVVRPGRSSAQKRLDREQRARAREGSLRCRVDLTGRRVVVLDDVLTTGSTLQEARRALEEAGAEVVAALCLAATPLAARASS